MENEAPIFRIKIEASFVEGGMVYDAYVCRFMRLDATHKANPHTFLQHCGFTTVQYYYVHNKAPPIYKVISRELGEHMCIDRHWYTLYMLQSNRKRYRAIIFVLFETLFQR